MQGKSSTPCWFIFSRPKARNIMGLQSDHYIGMLHTVTVFISYLKKNQSKEGRMWEQRGQRKVFLKGKTQTFNQSQPISTLNYWWRPQSTNVPSHSIKVCGLSPTFELNALLKTGPCPSDLPSPLPGTPQNSVCFFFFSRIKWCLSSQCADILTEKWKQKSSFTLQ